VLRFIKETDFILAVVPMVENTAGPVMAFLIPSEVIMNEIHAAERAGRKDWSLHLNEPRWAEYRLPGTAYAAALPPESEADVDEDEEIEEIPAASAAPLSLGDVIANARRAIAQAAGVAVSAVKISIDLN
jgi:hypothetical protein